MLMFCELQLELDVECSLLPGRLILSPLFWNPQGIVQYEHDFETNREGMTGDKRRLSTRSGPAEAYCGHPM